MLSTEDLIELSDIASSINEEAGGVISGIVVGGCPCERSQKGMESYIMIEYPVLCDRNKIPSPEKGHRRMFAVRCGDWVNIEGFGPVLFTVCYFEGTRAHRYIWVQSCMNNNKPAFKVPARCVIAVHRANSLDSSMIQESQVVEASVIKSKDDKDYHVIRITSDGIVLREGFHPYSRTQTGKELVDYLNYGEEELDNLEFFKERFISYTDFIQNSYRVIEPPRSKSSKKTKKPASVDVLDCYQTTNIESSFEMDGDFKKPVPVPVLSNTMKTCHDPVKRDPKPSMPKQNIQLKKKPTLF